MKLVRYNAEFMLYLFPRYEYERLGSGGIPGKQTVEIAGMVKKNDICLYEISDGLFVFNLTRAERGYIFDARYAMSFLHDIEDLRRKGYEDRATISNST